MTDFLLFIIMLCVVYILCAILNIYKKLADIHSQTRLLSRPIRVNIWLDKDFNIIKKDVQD